MYFPSGSGLSEVCRRENCPISEAMLRMESARSGRGREEVLEELRGDLKVMYNSVLEPLDDPQKSIGGLIGGEARRIMDRANRAKPLLDPLLRKAAAYSMGVLEQNSSMRLIVAAPTAGSAGVLPGVLFALREERGFGEEDLLRGLLCAGAVGYLYMRNATVAGSEAGCQAEIGVASSMTAAAVTEMGGGTPEQCLDAASIAMQNLLGLVCDPVAGLVQVPCQTRNASAAANALIAAEIVLSGVSSRIPFDEMVEAMYRVGRNMPCALRETALGGCAATPAGCAWKKKIFGGADAAKPAASEPQPK